jgi:hypothetical protein
MRKDARDSRQREALLAGTIISSTALEGVNLNSAEVEKPSRETNIDEAHDLFNESSGNAARHAGLRGLLHGFRVSVFLAPVFMTIFLYGCTGVAKDPKVRCYKCGAAFSVNEGLESYQAATGAGDTRVK